MVISIEQVGSWTENIVPNSFYYGKNIINLIKNILNILIEIKKNDKYVCYKKIENRNFRYQHNSRIKNKDYYRIKCFYQIQIFFPTRQSFD